jgi:hypothetical protein
MNTSDCWARTPQTKSRLRADSASWVGGLGSIARFVGGHGDSVRCSIAGLWLVVRCFNGLYTEVGPNRKRIVTGCMHVYFDIAFNVTALGSEKFRTFLHTSLAPCMTYIMLPPVKPGRGTNSPVYLGTSHKTLTLVSTSGKDLVALRY